MLKNNQKQSSIMSPKKVTARSRECSQKRMMTIDMKLEIIRKHGEGMRVIDLAKEYGRNKSTIGTILKQKEVLMASKPAKGLSIISKRRSSVNDEMEKLLLIWLQDKELAGDSVSESIIREKARVIYEDLVKNMPGISEDDVVEGSFKASRGWFEKFKIRTSTHSVVRHGETASLDAKCAEEFVVTFAELIDAEGYVAQQIFNCDETGLLWKKMPRGAFITAEETKMLGHKPMKDRLTLVLCANASGDCKVKPLLVYHSETPRAFKTHRVNKETLPVLWRSNPKTSVTRNIFVQWVNLVFGPTVKKFLQGNDLPLKALLVLDNATSHPPNFVDDILEEFKFIDVLFLPPSITPLLQPMDKQVISNFKKIYMENLFKRYFEVTESTNLTLQEFWKDHYNIATCLSLIDLSWQGVSRRILNSAWKKLWPQAVSGRTFKGFEQPEPVILEDIVSLGKSMGLEVNEDDIDDLLEGHSQELTKEELKEVQQQQQKSEVLKAWEEKTAEEEEEETATGDIKEMLSMWEKLRDFVEKRHPEKVATIRAGDLFNDTCLTHFRNILRGRSKQTSLDRFLVKRPLHDKSDGHQGKKRRLSESEDDPTPCCSSA
ncbi:tigger transposable element-derived protein 1-like [Erythrolamprus reginae]|uniref:tigger transposable element-derived protein 1-like n=1 Tax=Erythrolamprus reginae TaxID=121349 RepID=UPI00396C877A